MIRSLETRLRDLEKLFPQDHPGQDVASNWFKELLRHTPIFFWLWLTESQRPDRFPQWTGLRNAPGSPEYKEAMLLWREFRKQRWCNYFCACHNCVREYQSLYHYKSSKHLDVPSEAETARLNGNVLASIPLVVFDWAKIFYMNTSFKDLKRLGKIKSYLLVIAAGIVFFEPRANYWRKRLGPLKLSKVSLPEWAQVEKSNWQGKRIDLEGWRSVLKAIEMRSEN